MLQFLKQLKLFKNSKLMQIDVHITMHFLRFLWQQNFMKLLKHLN